MPVVAFFVVVNVSCALDPRYAMAGPAAANLFGYLVYMDFIALALVLAILLGIPG